MTRTVEERATRKEELRKVFEPMWRQAVQEALTNANARAPHADRVTMIDSMFRYFPRNIADRAAEMTLTSWEREDIKLLKELAYELCEQMRREAFN